MSREKMEKRLRESNERYRLLLDRALDAIWFTVYEKPIDITLSEMEIARLINETGIIVEANNAAAKECGFEEASQLVGRHWSEFIPFEENEEFYLKFVRSNYNIRGDTSVETDREGNIYHVENSLVGNIVDGKLVSSFGVGRDITRRVQAEEKLGRSAERVEHLNLVLHAIRNVNQLIVREKDRDKLLKGVCDNLVESRVYFNAWIVLLDESGKLVAHAESGLGKDFLPMVESLKRGQLTVCGQRALKQTETIVTEDPVSTCIDCPLSGSYVGRSAATARLEYDGKVYGLLTVSVPREVATGVEELVLFHEVAVDIAFALHNIELEEQHKQGEAELLLKDLVFEQSISANSIADNAGIITHVNDTFIKIWGHESRNEAVGKPISDFLRFEDEAKTIITALDETGKWEGEYTALRKDGTTFSAYGLTTIIPDESGNIIGYQSAVLDITERKEAERAQRESESFLHEVHHRVRNNLQLISSLLDMSRLRAHDQQAIDLFTDARTRLYTISIIHSQLYQNKNLSQIEMGFHVRELAKYLTQTYASGRNITIAIEISNIYLPLSQATPCALALSELISNALKHAFTEAQRGTIEISMRRSDEDMIIARVKDDGIGIHDESAIYKADSLGLKLCRNLIQQQLKGQIQLRRNKGTEFIIEFKLRGEEMKHE